MMFKMLIFCGYISCVIALIQDFYWRDYIPGDIPCDALKGVEGRYVGQAHSINSLTVATIHAFNNTATFVKSTGEKVIVDKFIKILCASDLSRFYWESVDFGKSHGIQLKDAVKGGFERDIILFIGKAIDEGEWKIGHVIQIGSPHKGLWVWRNTNGRTNRYYQFDLLKYNMTVVAGDGTIICND